tara:strand:- start:52282 stop:52500 length:219 start_codon:yes stop_codon:yes gene_type:complete
MAKVKEFTYSFRILCEDDDAPNPVHLCEEIQAYLNSNLDYYNEELDEHVNAEVTGYRVEIDKMTPYIAQDEY